ncbi:tetratricopeptide repeat protein [Pleurocapsa sp. PCC 7319]|uniref:tetratricopeptide repeat protein n=1 Tax=Pleurocapsa sp. PCC 7319 TaxID=118161 RepID=UPI00034B4519|nr:tetratricopeptide repeat protein [Pleurocapsa sp. PCC 7319]
MQLDSKVSTRKGLIDAMKTDFNQPIVSPIQYQTATLSSSQESTPASRSQCSLSNFNCLNFEQQLRCRVKEKASQGDYVLAITLLDQLIALCPDNAADYNNRGLMYFRNNQIVEALCDLTQALEINPNLDSAYNNRANCHAALGDLAEAIADYDLALDLNPTNLRAWINQGITFRELKMYELAIENFDIALIIGNSGLLERIYLERGRAYHLRGDWNCAVADYQKAIKILAPLPKLANYRLKAMTWLDELLCPLKIL